ncbi:MAG: MarR family transcriptional regulator [Cyclobacteriaceae bacterium]|nr:MarR family transcriptional regulator [Cyclobacteriaceae bacterium]
MASLEEEIKQTSFRTTQNKAIINLLFTSSFIAQKQLQLFRPYGLTIPQFNVLRILRGQYPKESTVNLLIDRMLDKSSNASRIVDKLEAKELVTRKKNPVDRRAVDVFISEKGLEILAKLDIEIANWENKNIQLTDEESRHLNLLLDKFRG